MRKPTRRPSLAWALAALVAAAMTGCTSTGDLSPAGKTVVTALCRVDSLAPAIVKAGGTVAVIVDPLNAPAVEAMNAADQVAHPAVVAACASVGGAPTAVALVPLKAAP